MPRDMDKAGVPVPKFAVEGYSQIVDQHWLELWFRPFPDHLDFMFYDKTTCARIPITIELLPTTINIMVDNNPAFPLSVTQFCKKFLKPVHSSRYQGSGEDNDAGAFKTEDPKQEMIKDLTVENTVAQKIVDHLIGSLNTLPVPTSEFVEGVTVKALFKLPTAYPLETILHLLKFPMLRALYSTEVNIPSFPKAYQELFADVVMEPDYKAILKMVFGSDTTKLSKLVGAKLIKVYKSMYRGDYKYVCDGKVTKDKDNQEGYLYVSADYGRSRGEFLLKEAADHLISEGILQVASEKYLDYSALNFGYLLRDLMSLDHMHSVLAEDPTINLLTSNRIAVAGGFLFDGSKYMQENSQNLAPIIATVRGFLKEYSPLMQRKILNTMDRLSDLHDTARQWVESEGKIPLKKKFKDTKDLHDYIAIEFRKLSTPKIDFKYEEEIKKIDKLQFVCRNIDAAKTGNPNALAEVIPIDAIPAARAAADTPPSESALSVNHERFEFRLPEHSHTLIEWGQLMNNCVGGYGSRVKDGSALVVGVFNPEGKMVYCIDAGQKRIHQFSGWSNGPTAPHHREQITKLLAQYNILSSKEV